ncbi:MULTISPECIES: hypothetical protein [Microcoleaceae]|nr:hypothetical protein [Tychonema sp. LEGE 06208]
MPRSVLLSWMTANYRLLFGNPDRMLQVNLQCPDRLTADCSQYD